jgi:hypothetical protein
MQQMDFLLAMLQADLVQHVGRLLQRQQRRDSNAEIAIQRQQHSDRSSGICAPSESILPSADMDWALPGGSPCGSCGNIEAAVGLCPGVE